MSFLPAPALQSYLYNPGGDLDSEWSGAFRPGPSTVFGTGPADSQQNISQFGFSTGALLGAQAVASLPAQNPLFQAAITLGGDGHLYWINAGNPMLAYRVDPSFTPFVLTDTASTTDINLEIEDQCYLTMGGTHWLVATGFGQANVNFQVVVFRADPPAYPTGGFGFWGHAYNDGGNLGGSCNACAGPQSASSATAYWTNKPFSIYHNQGGLNYFTLGKTVISAGAQGYNPSDWPTPNGDIASSIIHDYAPTDFDAAWTSIVSLSGPAYDETDGNVIVQVKGSGGGNANYIAKLAVADGSVLWQVAIGTLQGYDDSAPTRSRIHFGTYLYWDGTDCHSIDTSSGADTTQAFSVSLSITQQISDDVLGCVIGNVGWMGAGIDLLNATAASGATMGTVYFTPGGGGGGGGAGLPYDAVRRAWTYSMDGHTFYVLQLGAQGTWVYDATTQEWAQWDTATYGIWNMVNGCMWGYRVVAGSSQSTDVWELAPSLMMDESIFNIDHAVTGILDSRSRKYYAVESVNITASAGLIDETTGALFSLRFSDDQGQTWSGYFTVVLSDGDTTQEVAWRSLGSFGRPGRVFEFSDVGGLVRLDGADVFVDNFDEDQPQQDGQSQS